MFRNNASTTNKDEAADASEKKTKTSFFSGWFKNRNNANSFSSTVAAILWGEGKPENPAPIPLIKSDRGLSLSSSSSFNRRPRRSSTLSSTSIATYESSKNLNFGRQVEGDAGKLKLPAPTENERQLLIDATENELLDAELAIRAMVKSENSRIVFRLRYKPEEFLEMNALDDISGDAAHALFTIYMYASSDITDIPPHILETSERMIKNDPSRSQAISLVCRDGGYASQVVLTKRTSKGVDVSTSEVFSLFDYADVNLRSAGQLVVDLRAMTAVRWIVKDNVSRMATYSRLSTFGVRPTRFLGAGSTAAVCEADVTSGAKIVRAAVKTIASNEVFQRESKLLKAVRGCEGLPTLIGTISDLNTVVTFPVGVPLHKTKIGVVSRGSAFCPVIRGLRALRSRGIVHRDVSPGNMIVASEDNTELGLIDLGMAQRYSSGPRSYSGARSFSSDRISGFFASQNMLWSDINVQFAYEDDLESLIKTAVWLLDCRARKMINECAGRKKLQPNDVFNMWQCVWNETKLGMDAYSFLETNVRPLVGVDMDLDRIDAMYDKVSEWLQGIKVITVYQ